MSNELVNRAKLNFGIIGNSKLLNRAIEVALLVAPTDLPVLITGENGTGKESISKIIHHFSNRKNNKFIGINCGAIPEGTIDSELFGHDKGGFTGADNNRKGYFEEVDNGTIFLDEIGEMPLGAQVRLLRVLGSNEIIRVGSSKVQSINVRVIAATNVDLIRKVNEGKFREDLYYRLNTVQIKVPPLRDRGNDIISLFVRFAGNFADKYKVDPISLTEDSERLITKYQFPGNIRQLKNIVDQMSVLELNREIEPDVLEKYLPENEKMFLSLNTGNNNFSDDFIIDKEKIQLLYKMILELKKENNEFKRILFDLVSGREVKNIKSLEN